MNNELLQEHIADFARALGVTVKDKKLATSALQGMIACCSGEEEPDDEKPDLAIILGAKKPKG